MRDNVAFYYTTFYSRNRVWAQPHVLCMRHTGKKYSNLGMLEGNIERCLPKIVEIIWRAMVNQKVFQTFLVPDNYNLFTWKRRASFVFGVDNDIFLDF